MPIIWSEAYLQGQLEQAEYDAVSKVDYLFQRISLSVTKGQSTYSLPSYYRKIQRVTWKGYKVYPISFRELCDLSPESAVASETYKYESAEGRPYYYSLNPSDFRQIRFYPTPNETIAAHTTEDINGASISSFVIFSIWRSPDLTDTSWMLPDYISRRTTKAYALAAAFAKEGKGQNLKAVKYYEGKYDYLISQFRKINSHCYMSRRLRLEDQFNLSGFGRRPARPVLPVNFERQQIF